jgi:hypothetical protein
MRSDRVVVLAPLLDDDGGLLQAVEDFAVEAFVAELAVEGLAVAILPWAAGSYVERLRPQRCEPVAYDLCRHLRAVVRPDVLRHTLASRQFLYEYIPVGAAAISRYVGIASTVSRCRKMNVSVSPPAMLANFVIRGVSLLVACLIRNRLCTKAFSIIVFRSHSSRPDLSSTPLC